LGKIVSLSSPLHLDPEEIAGANPVLAITKMEKKSVRFK